jgi:acyl dehydratase
MKLQNAAAICELPVDYAGASPLRRAGFLQTICFSIASGDWNENHVNPFTMLSYQSNLGGMTCPGDLVLGKTKAALQGALTFVEPTETIAHGYTRVTFRKPLRVGMRFRCRFRLIDRKVLKKNLALCHWDITVVNTGGETLCEAQWRAFYKPVERATFRQALRTLKNCFAR